MNVVKQLLHHVNNAFGNRGELYQSEEVDVLIAVYPATRKRGWWTYVTLELHQTGGTELRLFVPVHSRDDHPPRARGRTGGPAVARADDQGADGNGVHPRLHRQQFPAGVSRWRT